MNRDKLGRVQVRDGVRITFWPSLFHVKISL